MRFLMFAVFMLAVFAVDEALLAEPVDPAAEAKNRSEEAEGKEAVREAEESGTHSWDAQIGRAHV